MSDFGKQALESETLHGPQGIWTKSGSNDEGNDDDDGEDDNEDLYDKIQISGPLSDDDEENDEVEEGEGYEGDGVGGDDFTRPANATGVVLHSELKRRSGRKVASDLDDLAVRAYEKKRLSYYFAIAECDSVSTATALYEEVRNYGLNIILKSHEYQYTTISSSMEWNSSTRRWYLTFDSCPTILGKTPTGPQLVDTHLSKLTRRFKLRRTHSQGVGFVRGGAVPSSGLHHQGSAAHKGFMQLGRGRRR